MCSIAVREARSPSPASSSKLSDKKRLDTLVQTDRVGLCYGDAGSFAGREERLNGSRYWR
ncbi:hypothetical protein [Thermocoleostomius sinensis]|uniref:Uncharacterized protein n=1 Tax=Thermocoleostomius sinensis A174 TaxID=2016057 RepID=A0A9E9CAP3_9CYAN|nr:hypothetical protein [Thermocoleostomius sinensis]WAL61247.1 hypothetical protein OXH18_04395 [Thermocoleostomius sinensis A174]